LPPQLLGIDMNARLHHVSSEHLRFLEHHHTAVFVSATESN
jgi:hypothetical protein